MQIIFPCRYPGNRKATIQIGSSPFQRLLEHNSSTDHRFPTVFIQYCPFYNPFSFQQCCGTGQPDKTKQTDLKKHT